MFLIASLLVVSFVANIGLIAALLACLRCTEFDCWNRQFLVFLPLLQLFTPGSKSLIFLDIDRMKELNAELGYHQVNLLIRKALQGFRTDVIRYFSGDELICICPHRSADRIADRILDQLNAVGIEATLAHEKFDGLRSIKTASERVLQAKQNGQKNRVLKCFEVEVNQWLEVEKLQVEPRSI